ncbi:type II secretion system protein [Planctomycetota bacterium]
MHKTKGFTLIELLVVIAIIALLMASSGRAITWGASALTGTMDS